MSFEEALETLDMEILSKVLNESIEKKNEKDLTEKGKKILSALEEQFESKQLKKIKFKPFTHLYVYVGALCESGADATQLLPAAFAIAARLINISENPRSAKVNSKTLKLLVHRVELTYSSIVSRAKLDSRVSVASTADALDFRRQSIELRWSARKLQRAANLLDDSKLLVLCPHGRWGARVRIRGISGNGQLQWLLAEALKGALPAEQVDWELPHKDVMAVYHGGEVSLDNLVSEVPGVWNLYNWFALDNNKKLYGRQSNLPATGTWIWTEGTPSDIDTCDRMPAEDAVRVVLVGPVPYKRMVPVSVDFASLKAHAHVDEVLTGVKVDKLLESLASVDERIKNSSMRRVCMETNVARNEVERNEVEVEPARFF